MENFDEDELKLLDFIKHIRSILSKANRNFSSKYNTELSFTNILHYCALMILNKYSFANIRSLFEINYGLELSKKTYITSKQKISVKDMQRLVDNLINYIYNDQNIMRIIATDGCYVDLNPYLKKDGFKCNKGNYYCCGLINTPYDISNEIPLNYYLSQGKNERAVLCEQLQYLREEDLLVMNRGYFSYDLLQILYKKNIRSLFRMDSDSIFIKKLNGETDKTFKIQLDKDDDLITIRFIRYSINNYDYYLLTTCDCLTKDQLIQIYWYRRGIETHFRYSKYYLSLNEIKSTTLSNVSIDILIHQFIFIISSYIQSINQKIIKKKFKINTSNHLIITINHILDKFFYNSNTLNNNQEIL